MDSISEQRKSFEEEWMAARKAVLGYCIRALKNYHTAEDVTQQVALRALRGYPTFKGNSNFLGWVFAIARNQVLNQFERENKRALRETAWDDELEDRIPGHTANAISDNVRESVTLDQVLQAAQGSALSEIEVQVVRLSLKDSGLTWADIGPKLGMSATAAAVANCRAIPKLRVFIFRNYPMLLGGRRCIEEAFALAKIHASKPLSQPEIAAFEALILNEDNAYRKAGWQSNLRTACDKVIQRLAPGTACDLFKPSKSPSMNK